MLNFIKKWLILPIAFLAGYIYYFLHKRGEFVAKQQLADRLEELKLEKERQRGVVNESNKDWAERRDKYSVDRDGT